MTRIEELELKVKELQREIKQLKEEQNNIETPKNWKPQFDEKFWYRNVDGEIFGLFWKNTEFDKGIAKYNPIFRTQKECLKYCNYKNILAEKSYKFSDEEWNNPKICKFYIYCFMGEKEFNIDHNISARRINSVYFKTREDAQYMIDNYSEEMLKWGIMND